MVRTEDDPKVCTYPRCDCPQQCVARVLPENIRLRRAERVPNRLYGVTINHEGDAI